MAQNFKTLIHYLKLLEREKATLISWEPDYESVNGKHTGKLWITVIIQEQ